MPYNPCANAGSGCAATCLTNTITPDIPMGSLELASRYNYLLEGLLPGSPLTLTPLCNPNTSQTQTYLCCMTRPTRQDLAPVSYGTP